MEEEPEKRRERLQALRAEAEAAQAQGEPAPSPATQSPLSNPLVVPPAPPPSAAESASPVPRFDYYTDPMSAFSASKRRSASGGGYNPPSRPGAGPRNYQIGNSHAPVTPQFHVNQSPDQSSFQMSFPLPHSDQWRSPVQFGSPYSGHRGSHFSGPGWNRSGGFSGHGYPPNQSRGGFRSPRFGQGDSPRTSLGRVGSPMSNPGMGSPRSNSGRGSGRRFGGSPSPGRSGGRGRGFRDSGLGRQEPEHFYIKSMLKDPWRKLKPIVGNILEPRAGSDAWLPKSLTATKKAKVTESSKEFKSQSSLAEYLALSFEEAMSDATSA